MKRLLALLVASVLVVVAPTASGNRTDATVRVTITRGGCAVSPRAIQAGAAVFQIANRSERPAAFSVAGKRRSVAVGRQGRLVVMVRAGRVAYSCVVAGRRVRGGSLRVAAVPQAPVEHRIGVRNVSGVGEFYDRVTGAKFVPRGSNYIRLASQRNHSGGLQVYHSTFNVGQYEGDGADAALSRMAADGYTVVRVFLSQICVDACAGDPNTGSLRTAYFANVVDFLRRARAHGIFVLLTSDWLPPYTRYIDALASVRREWFDDVNQLFLSPQGIVAQQQLWTDMVKALLRQNAPMDTVFAYELWNEANVLSDKAPFSLTSGRVTAANGQTYDMANASDRKRIIDDAFVFLMDEVRVSIREVDPTALVTMGFFHDTAPNPARRGDPRLVRTRAVIERSTADFVDIHPYPDDELTFPEFMQNYGIDGPVAKPIIIGEFGVSKRASLSASQAAAALVSWQRQSCAYHIDGWLLWTWDSDEHWNALDDGGVIERALSPKGRPDPCG